MTVNDVIRKALLPLMFISFWCWMAITTMEVSGCDNILILFIILGFPFGLHKMRLVLVPRGMDLGGTIGIAAICVIAGALVGCIMLPVYMVKAVYVLIRFVFCI